MKGVHQTGNDQGGVADENQTSVENPEVIEQNDRNVSADYGGRAEKTNRLPDPGIQPAGPKNPDR